MVEIKLPTEQQCFKYFDDYNVPENILKHCLKVRKVAVFLANKLKNKLKESGADINIELIDRTALLHDLFKAGVISNLKPNKFHQQNFSQEELAMRELLRQKYPNMYEGEIAHAIFKEEFPELALALRNCSSLGNLNPSWEELIVHYADFRVLKEEVVPLDVRKAYLQEIYPAKEGLWDLYLEKMKEVESKIFSNVDFAPVNLATEMEIGMEAEKEMETRDGGESEDEDKDENGEEDKDEEEEEYEDGSI